MKKVSLKAGGGKEARTVGNFLTKHRLGTDSLSALSKGGWHNSLHRPQFQGPCCTLHATYQPQHLYSLLTRIQAELGCALPKVPEVFFKPAECLNDPCGNVVVPATAPSALDAEVELAIVIGKDCKNVDKSSALDYVLGYTVANDVTARDVQSRVSQWSFSKGYDGFCPLGPVIVRADLPGFHVTNLPMKTTLNGEVLQDGNSSKMIFSVEEIVSYLSQDTTLPAGTVIITGTPSGIGHSYKPPKYIKPGDDLSVSIGGVGTLRNSLVAAVRL